MKYNESTVFVFIACIIIGLLISTNISFSTTPKRVYLDSKQYQDAYNQRTKLIADISGLQGKYNDYRDKIYKYESFTKDNDIVTEMSNELTNNKIIMGTIDVHGPGVEIAIDDSPDSHMPSLATPFKFVHNFDLVQVFNDLKSGGAEAISINGERVLFNSSIYCYGNYISINGVRLAAPFTIDAIGNPDVLQTYMLDSQNYLKFMVVRGLRVNVVKKEILLIPSIDVALKINFAKSVGNNTK